MLNICYDALIMYYNIQQHMTIHYNALSYAAIHYTTLSYTIANYKTLSYTDALSHTIVHNRTLNYTIKHYNALLMHYNPLLGFGRFPAVWALGFLEVGTGSSRGQNPYHNGVHAADAGPPSLWYIMVQYSIL